MLSQVERIAVDNTGISRQRYAMQWYPKFLLISSMMTLLACAPPALANAESSFAPIDFSLRFPAALAKFSSYADVAGFGGASAGSRYGSGVNPASSDWMPPPGAPFSISPQVSRVGFDHGAALRIATVSGSFSSSTYGTLQPSYARVTNEGSMSGDFLLTEGNYAQLQWGKKLDDRLAVGANVSHSQFKTKAGFGSQLAADGDSRSNSVRGGVLWAASQNLLAGLVMDYSSGHSASLLLDPTCFCFGRFDDTSHAATARLGMTYEYAPKSSLYADYLIGRYRNDAMSMVSRTAMAGVEHLILPWLYVRAGVAYELRGAWGKTVGIGIMPSKTMSIDFALQRDMFPELHPEFGRATLANLSISVAF
jgi:hypothetical protein